MAAVNIDAAGTPHGQPDVERILSTNSVEEFDQLRGVPGFRLDSTSWEEAGQLVDENTERSLGKLGRHPSGIIVYRTFRAKVLQEFASMGDYVKVKVFSFSTNPQADGRKAAVDPTEPEDPEHPTILWRVNDFPYYLDPGIEHHCVWCRTPLSEEQLTEFVKQHREGYEWMYFVNSPALASIPAVWHAHILSRKPQQQ